MYLRSFFCKPLKYIIQYCKSCRKTFYIFFSATNKRIEKFTSYLYEFVKVYWYAQQWCRNWSIVLNVRVFLTRSNLKYLKTFVFFFDKSIQLCMRNGMLKMKTAFSCLVCIVILGRSIRAPRQLFIRNLILTCR